MRVLDVSYILMERIPVFYLRNRYCVYIFHTRSLPLRLRVRSSSQNRLNFILFYLKPTWESDEVETNA